MPNTESRHSAVAKRYGGVLLALAQESKAPEDILQDITRLHHCLLQEPREWNRVTSPTTPLRIQYQIIEKLAASLKLGSLIIRFVKLVCQNHRLPYLISMLENVTEGYKTAAGSVEGVLETATELSQQEIETLQASLTQKLGKKVNLHQVTKKSLLGGIALRVGSLMIDTSVRTQLNKLRQVMKG